MLRVTSRAKRSAIFKRKSPSGVDARPVVAVGLEFLHERQAAVPLLSRVEQHDRHVAGAATELLEQRGRAEEWIEGTGATEQHQGPVGIDGVLLAEGLDALLDV